MKRLEDKVAVVTGGNSGIGLATAKRLQEEGARLAIVGRNAHTLEEATKTIGNGVLAVQADVAVLSDIDRLYGTITQELGRIDVLFVNAGVGKFASLIDTSESLYDEMFAINTKGAYFTLTKAIPYLNDGASIILIALAPINPSWRRPGTSAYSAAKAALRAVGRSGKRGGLPSIVRRLLHYGRRDSRRWRNGLGSRWGSLSRPKSNSAAPSPLKHSGGGSGLLR